LRFTAADDSQALETDRPGACRWPRRGPALRRQPAHARYLHVSEKEPLDEAVFVAWVKAASAIPGEKMW